MKYTVQVLKRKRLNWTTYWWRLIADNGQVVAHSEVYSSRQACQKTAKKVAFYSGFNYEIINNLKK
jgi:uncharacterized protein YegP (UPF0339 family)